jgi:hypothetical protein
MSLIRELKNLGATIAWSPTAREPSMLAIGTKEGAGTGFDNYGGELQVGADWGDDECGVGGDSLPLP